MVSYPQEPCDVRLHDTRFGDSGPPIAFCHGLFGQGKNWTTLGKQIAQDHRVVLVDMPNHGRSDATHDFSYEEHADIVASHLRSISDEPWRVVGHSMGGKIAMGIALRYPELVERLVVVDISPVQYPGMRDIHAYARAMHSLDLSTLESRAEADRLLTEEVPSPTIRSFLLQNLRRVDGRWAWQLNIGLLLDRMDQLAGWPDTEKTYSGPVLWVAGSKSGYIKAEYADAMRQLFPATLLVTVKNAGHWVHSEKPQVFGEALRTFLDHDFSDDA